MTDATTAPATRSRATNGSLFWVDDADGRSASARRFKDILAAVVADLGGASELSEAQRQLCRRVALLSLQCEAEEGRAVAGEAIDFDSYGTMVNVLARTLRTLGLKRIPRDVSLDLQSYLRAKAAEAQAA